MWQFIDAIETEWDKNSIPLNSYPPDTEKPMIESQHIDQSKDVLSSILIRRS
jgi:glucose-6-phosphate 1-dehydrogenase